MGLGWELGIEGVGLGWRELGVVGVGIRGLG